MSHPLVLQKKKRAAEAEANGTAEEKPKKKKKKAALDAETVAGTAETLATLAEATLPVQEEEDGAEAADPTEKKKKKKKHLAEDPGAAEGQLLTVCQRPSNCSMTTCNTQHATQNMQYHNNIT